jgi:hypothetical protein
LLEAGVSAARRLREHYVKFGGPALGERLGLGARKTCDHDCRHEDKMATELHAAQHSNWSATSSAVGKQHRKYQDINILETPTPREGFQACGRGVQLLNIDGAIDVVNSAIC